MKRTQNKRAAHDDSCVVFGIDYSRNGRYKIYRVTEKGENETNFCYDVAAMEAAETPVEEEGVLCYEVFKGWYMILREYTICQERISTQELAELICGTTDHVVVANFK